MAKNKKVIREQKKYTANIIPQIAAFVNTPHGGKLK